MGYAGRTTPGRNATGDGEWLPADTHHIGDIFPKVAHCSLKGSQRRSPIWGAIEGNDIPFLARIFLCGKKRVGLLVLYCFQGGVGGVGGYHKHSQPMPLLAEKKKNLKCSEGGGSRTNVRFNAAE